MSVIGNVNVDQDELMNTDETDETIEVIYYNVESSRDLKSSTETQDGSTS